MKKLHFTIDEVLKSNLDRPNHYHYQIHLIVEQAKSIVVWFVQQPDEFDSGNDLNVTINEVLESNLDRPNYYHYPIHLVVEQTKPTILESAKSLRFHPCLA